MVIIVPSIGRAKIQCPTAKWLVNTKREVRFAVHEDEITDYKIAYPWASTWCIPDEYRHHDGKLRKYFLDQIKEPYFSVDDDVRVSLKTLATIDDMFDLLEHHIKCGITHAGIGQQLFCNAAKIQMINDDPFAVPSKFASLVYAIDPRPYANCDLPRLRIYGDVALSIHAIQYGGGSLVTFQVTHSNASPPHGGCNSWRTREIIIEDLQAICSMYPDICTIRDTEATTHSQYIGIGLRVAWSKIKKLN
jgi:hypothetical protein